MPPVKVKQQGENAFYELAPSGDFDRDVGKSHVRDFDALAQGKVSITPLSSQLIHEPFFDSMKDWLSSFNR
jgi:broad specificity polyphosphatase/5'/3'-nucleotidase SurE